MKKFVHIALIGATSMASVMASPALAAVTNLQAVTPQEANGETLGAMDSFCQAAIPGGEGEWTAEVVNVGGPSYVSGPDVESGRTIDPLTVAGTGTSNLVGPYYIGSDPFRNGGSVNMFGVQYAPTKHWTNSTYDFTASYGSVYSFSFQCKITQTIHHPDLIQYTTYPDGYYTNASEPANDQAQSGQSCNGINYHNPNWGSDIGNWGTKRTKIEGTVPPQFIEEPVFHGCLWNGTGTFDVETGRTPVPDTVNVTFVDGDSVSQTQHDTLLAHEDWGGPTDESGQFWVGNPVICISPKKLPGTWTQQNGYTGSKCTTAWFNDPSIVWNAAHVTTSTYISVPAY